MSPTASPLRLGPVALQAALVLIGVSALALYPPREGAIMLVAIDGSDAGRLAAPAIHAGAALTGRGPLDNMLLVRGERHRLLPLLARGIVPLAAPRIWCGGENRT